MKDKKEPAKFISRFIAYMLDVLIVAAISSLIAVPFMSDKIDDINKISTQTEEIVQKLSRQEISIKEYIDESASLTYQSSKYQGGEILITVLIEILYFIIFQFYNGGQTLGKKLMKIKVVSSNGELTMNQMLVRSLLINSIFIGLFQVFIVSMVKDPITFFYTEGTVELIVYLFIIISVFMIMFTKDRKGLHDHITKTEVITY